MYCENNPIAYCDPYGTFAILLGIAFALMVIGVVMLATNVAVSSAAYGMSQTGGFTPSWQPAANPGGTTWGTTGGTNTSTPSVSTPTTPATQPVPSTPSQPYAPVFPMLPSSIPSTPSAPAIPSSSSVPSLPFIPSVTSINNVSPTTANVQQSVTVSLEADNVQFTDISLACEVYHELIFSQVADLYNDETPMPEDASYIASLFNISIELAITIIMQLAAEHTKRTGSKKKTNDKHTKPRSGRLSEKKKAKSRVAKESK